MAGMEAVADGRKISQERGQAGFVDQEGASQQKFFLGVHLGVSGFL
jgi:hypothetical protein